MSERDHVRGSGAVRADVSDLNRDGRGDRLVSYAKGALTDARTETPIYLNRNGGANRIGRGDSSG